MFKLQINFDRHNVGLKSSYFLRFDLPNFSLPSAFNGETLRYRLLCTQSKLIPLSRIDDYAPTPTPMDEGSKWG
jgi:hypothetical protein